VPGAPEPLVPQPAEQGLASAAPRDVAELVDGAWAGLLEVADQVDPGAPSRLPGWTAHDVLVHLGNWPGEGRLDRQLEDARTGRLRSFDDVDARNAGLVAEHRDASRAEVLAALRAARERAAAFLADPDADVLGRRPVLSRVGELPATGVLVAQAFELAVHALDLVPAGAPAPPAALLDAGVGALVDVTAALAARRGLECSFAVVTPQARWAAGVRNEAWTTVRLEGAVPARQLPWPAVEATAADVLDAAAGRTLAAQLLLTRRLRLHDVPGLLRLLPALDAAPGLPGGSALQAAARAIGQAGALVGRLLR
jgi:uncharacterized protein (TIGR03083 family)